MAALEDSITALVTESMAEATQETIRAAKRRLATLKGHLTIKRNYLKNKQDSLVSSSAAANPNHAVLRSLSDELQRNVERMLTVAEKFQTAVSQYLAMGEGSAEETSTYYTTFFSSILDLKRSLFCCFTQPGSFYTTDKGASIPRGFFFSLHEKELSKIQAFKAASWNSSLISKEINLILEIYPEMIREFPLIFE